MASGRPLTEAFIRVRVDADDVMPDTVRATERAAEVAGRAAGRKLTAAFRAAGRDSGEALGRELDTSTGRAARRTTKTVVDVFRGAGKDSARVLGDGLEAGAEQAGERVRRTLRERLARTRGDARKAGEDAGEGFTRGVNDEVTDGSRGLVRTVGSTATKLSGLFAGAFVATQAVDFFKQSVKAASDLSEAGNKLQVLFGPAAPRIEQFAAGAATALGQSKLQAIDAAASFGVFAKSAGLAGNEAAKFSTDAVALSADLASFFNTSPEEAIEAIGAAFRGESEPIRRYGVLLDDATLRNRALALGLIRTTKEALTPQQRVLAAQAEILAQTSAAQGDFARTSGGLANQQRILAAQFENTKGQLGESLLPVVLDLVTTLNTSVLPAVGSFIGFMRDLPGPVVQAGLVVAGLVAAVGLGGAVFNRLSGFVQTLGDNLSQLGGKPAGSVNGLRASVGAIAGALAGPWGLAFTAATTVAGLWAQKQIEAKANVDALTDAIKADSGALGENTRAKIINRLESDGLLKDAQALGVSLSAVASAALGDAAALRQVNAVLGPVITGGNQLADSMGEGAVAIGGNFQAASNLQRALGGLSGEAAEAKASYDRQTAAMGSGTTAAGAAAKATAQLGASAAGTKTKQELLTEATANLQVELDKLAGGFLGTRAADRAYRDSITATREALKENGKTLDVARVKGRANQAALDGQASSALSYLSAVNKQFGPGQKFNAALGRTRADLVATGRRFGLSEQAAKKYADQILDVPKEATTKVATPGALKAGQTIRNLDRDINNINNKTASVSINAKGTLTAQVLRSLGNVGGRPATDRRVGDGYGLAAGGRVPGSSPHKHADNIPVAATAGEHMWSVDEVQGAGGHSSVARLRGMARTGALRLARGGPVEREVTAPTRGNVPKGYERTVDRAQTSFLQNTVSALNDRIDVGGVVGQGAGGTAGALGWQRMIAVLRRAFPGLALNSGYRPGAITATGRRSFHSMGRAVDVPPRRDVFEWIRANYPNATELIYSPAGARQLYKGRNHVYTGVTRRNHFDHVHWAMDQGGLADGLGFMAKATIKPERVLSPKQTEAFEDALGRNFTGGSDRADLDYLASAIVSGIVGGLGGRRDVTLDGRAVVGSVDRLLGATYGLGI